MQVVEDILEMVDKFKHRPGAILLTPGPSETILCRYPHEHFMIDFAIKGVIKAAGYYDIASLSSGDFKIYSTSDSNSKLFRGRHSKWDKVFRAFEAPQDKFFYEDFIFDERMQQLLEIAPVFNEGADLVLEGIQVLKNKVVVSNGVILFSTDVGLTPTRTFNIPLHILGFTSKNAGVAVQTLGQRADEVDFNCVSGMDWQLYYMNVGGYPEVDSIVPVPWNTELDFDKLRDVVYTNLKNIDGDSYVCNMHFKPNESSYRVQFVSLDTDEEPVDTLEVAVEGLLLQPTSSSECFLQLDLLQLEKLCRLNIAPNTLRFTWSNQVILPVSLGDSVTSNFALVMPKKPGKDFHWISG